MQSNPENSDPSGTMPREELNPLLNPLLAQNMGRWAEVYYKAAPEDRERAVEGLLHELQGGAGERSSAAYEPALAQNGFEVNESSGLYDPEDSGKLIRCSQCGHENQPDYNFCGGCRAPLAGSEAISGEASATEQREPAWAALY